MGSALSGQKLSTCNSTSAVFFVFVVAVICLELPVAMAAGRARGAHTRSVRAQTNHHFLLFVPHLSAQKFVALPIRCASKIPSRLNTKREKGSKTTTGPRGLRLPSVACPNFLLCHRFESRWDEAISKRGPPSVSGILFLNFPPLTSSPSPRSFCFQPRLPGLCRNQNIAGNHGSRPLGLNHICSRDLDHIQRKV